MKTAILFLLFLFLAGCTNQESALIASIEKSGNDTSFFRPTQCEDYPIRSSGGESTTLIALAEADQAHIISKIQLNGTEENREKAVQVKEVQIRPESNLVKGFIIFVDDQDKSVISTGYTIRIDFFQFDGFSEDSNPTLIHTIIIQPERKDFYDITYQKEAGLPLQAIAYLFEVPLSDFSMAPTSCLGYANITLTEKNANRNLETFFLFTEKLPFNISITEPEENEVIVLVGEDASTPELAKKPFLWRIEGKKPSYLFGTLHVDDERILTIPDVVIQAVQQSDIIYTEIKLDYISISQTFDFYKRNDGKALTDLLPPDLYDQIRQALFLKGDNILHYSDLKLWVLYFALSEEKEEIQDDNPQLDEYISNLGTASGKKLQGLEKIEDHNDAFESLTSEELIILLNDSVAVSSDINELTGSIIDLYLLSDEGLMLYSLNFTENSVDEKLHEKLDYERNKRMSEKIDVMIKQQPETGFFFAVGLAHYLGDRSIVSLLREKGYNISRVEFSPQDICPAPFLRKQGKCYLPYRKHGSISIQKNIPLCDEIKTSYIKSYCYSDMALKRVDIEYCSILEWNTVVCILATTKKSRNEEGCNLLATSERDICYYNLAYLLNEPELCGKMSFSVESPAICYTYFAAKGKDSSWCDKIEVDGDFRYSFVYPFNLDEKNILLLDSVYKENSLKQACKKSYRNIMPVFKKIVPDEKYYLNDTSSLLSEELIFVNLTSQGLFQECQSSLKDPFRTACLAMETGDVTVCSQLQLKKDDCYFHFATHFNDIDVCDNIKQQALHDKCIATIVVKTS